MSETKIEYDIFDNYVPKWMSPIPFKLGYRTQKWNPRFNTFRVYDRVNGNIVEIWIGGFPPLREYMPCPSWRMLFNDIMRELWDQIR